MGGRAHGVTIPIEARPWLSTEEAMGMCFCADEQTFRQNFTDKGLKWWRRIGKKVFYLKKDIYEFIDEHGQHYDQYQQPRGRKKKKVEGDEQFFVEEQKQFLEQQV